MNSGIDIEKEKREIRAASEKLISGVSAKAVFHMKIEIAITNCDHNYFQSGEKYPPTNPVTLLARKWEAPYEPDASSRDKSQWYALLALYIIDRWDSIAPESLATQFLLQAFAQATIFDEKAKVTEYRQRMANSETSKRLTNKRHGPNRDLRELAVTYARREIKDRRNRGHSVEPKALAGEVWTAIKPFNSYPGTDKPIIGKSASGVDDVLAEERVYKWILKAIRDGELAP